MQGHQRVFLPIAGTERRRSGLERADSNEVEAGAEQVTDRNRDARQRAGHNAKPNLHQ